MVRDSSEGDGCPVIEFVLFRFRLPALSGRKKGLPRG